MNIHEHPLCRDRIVSDPDIQGGKAVVKGTRIPVSLVLESLAHDPEMKTLMEDYPRLTIEDIKACLAYAHALSEEEDKKPKKKPFDRAKWLKAVEEAQEVWADVDADEMIAYIRRGREEGSRGFDNP